MIVIQQNQNFTTPRDKGWAFYTFLKGQSQQFLDLRSIQTTPALPEKLCGKLIVVTHLIRDLVLPCKLIGCNSNFRKGNLLFATEVEHF